MKSKLKKQDQKLLRNEYDSDNIFGIPTVRKCSINNKSLKFIAFDQVDNSKRNSEEKSIHFFIDDDKFNKVYDKAEKHFEKLAKFEVVLTPDFSLYADMPLAIQINSVFKNRWCGAYWQDLGFRCVIPTINWGDERSYEFCFLGVEMGSVVAVSTLGSRREKDLFIKGYKKMMEVIKPIQIFCYDEPFDEMEGEILYVEYIPNRGG